MVNITKLDLEKFEKINSGTFGYIYKVDRDTVFKVYKPLVPADYTKIEMRNPALNLPLLRYKELVRRSNSFKLNEGIYDLLFIDGVFAGVVMNYVDGNILYDKMDDPLTTRLAISRQMIRNAKELNHKLIYHTDHKLNNMIVHNGRLTFIDLDDNHTHVSHFPNPLLKLIEVVALKYPIGVYMGEYQRYNVHNGNLKRLGRKTINWAFTYNKLNNYLDSIEKEKTMLFIDENNDMDRVLELQKEHGFKVVFLVDSEIETPEKIKMILDYYRDNNIDIYDLLYRPNIGKYDFLENMKEGFIMNDKQLKRVYKK